MGTTGGDPIPADEVQCQRKILSMLNKEKETKAARHDFKRGLWFKCQASLCVSQCTREGGLGAGIHGMLTCKLLDWCTEEPLCDRPPGLLLGYSVSSYDPFALLFCCVGMSLMQRWFRLSCSRRDQALLGSMLMQH